jgi:dihydroxyacetone kinase-like protein
MKSTDIFNHIENIEIQISNHKDEIEKLDQEIGDGDHIFNILRGLKEVIKIKEDCINEPIDKIFKQLGMKIMTTVGGSSGALFATLLIGMSKKYDVKLNNLENISNMFFEGVEAMKKRGKSDIGEKTMLDVLIPVAIKLKNIQNEQNMKLVAEEITKVAEEGMLATKNLIATKGRASFLGERAKGHIDPGARSSQLAIKAICDKIIE